MFGKWLRSHWSDEEDDDDDDEEEEEKGTQEEYSLDHYFHTVFKIRFCFLSQFSWESLH